MYLVQPDALGFILAGVIIVLKVFDVWRVESGRDCRMTSTRSQMSSSRFICLRTDILHIKV